MNALQQTIQQGKFDETWAMNLLQAHGIVSDNCITADEVDEADCPRAIAFLTPDLSPVSAEKREQMAFF